MSNIQRALESNPQRGEKHFTEEQEVLKLAEKGDEQKAAEYTEVVREYWAPFLYPNVLCELGRTDPYVGAEFNEDGVELDISWAEARWTSVNWTSKTCGTMHTSVFGSSASKSDALYEEIGRAIMTA